MPKLKALVSGRRSGLGVNAGLRIERSGFDPRPGHCVAFLGKTLYYHSASLGKPDEMLGGYLQWTSIPSRRSSNIPSHFMLRKPG